MALFKFELNWMFNGVGMTSPTYRHFIWAHIEIWSWVLHLISLPSNTEKTYPYYRRRGAWSILLCERTRLTSDCSWFCLECAKLQSPTPTHFFVPYNSRPAKSKRKSPKERLMTFSSSTKSIATILAERNASR